MTILKPIIFKSMLLLVVIIAISVSCDEYLGGTVDCSECMEWEPDSADLIIDLTYRVGEIDTVPLIIYNGSIEEDSIEWVDTAYGEEFRLYVALDRYYSVKAEYTIGDKKIIAIDGDKILAKHVSESCEYECWVITRGILNVELKYEDF